MFEVSFRDRVWLVTFREITEPQTSWSPGYEEREVLSCECAKTGNSMMGLLERYDRRFPHMRIWDDLIEDVKRSKSYNEFLDVQYEVFD